MTTTPKTAPVRRPRGAPKPPPVPKWRVPVPARSALYYAPAAGAPCPMLAALHRAAPRLDAEVRAVCQPFLCAAQPALAVPKGAAPATERHPAHYARLVATFRAYLQAPGDAELRLRAAHRAYWESEWPAGTLAAAPTGAQ